MLSWNGLIRDYNWSTHLSKNFPYNLALDMNNNVNDYVQWFALPMLIYLESSGVPIALHNTKTCWKMKQN